MAEETIPAALVVRKGRAKDFERVRTYLASTTTHMALLHPTSCELEILTVPSDVEEHLGVERLYVVESEEEIVGHFFIWDTDEKQQWIQVIGAFVDGCRQSVAAAACRLFFDMMFQQKHPHKLMLLAHPESSFFFKLARSLGLFLEGTLRKHVALSGEWQDVCVFSLLSGEVVAKDVVVTKDLRYDWLLERARYDEVDVFVVRAVILKMQPKTIEVLLLRRTKNVVLPEVEETPGGKMQAGESILEALSREVKETIGVEIEKEINFLTSFDFTSVEGKRVREFVFRVKPLSWDVKLHGEEYGSYCWLPLQELPNSRLHPDMIQILASYSPTASYETESSPDHTGETLIELIRPPFAKFEEALLTGLHLDAYAVRGLNVVDVFGFSLRDGANKMVGGLLVDLAYGCCIVRRLWVDPAWRRLGWGRKLMIRAESLAKEKGCTFALADVMDWEDLPFFQKLGYTIEGQVSGFMSGARMFRIRKQF